jgi:hypothetical protein
MLRLPGILFLLLMLNHTALAWENHAMLTKMVLDQWSKNDASAALRLNQPIKTETLESFLRATKTTLPGKLAEIEYWAVHHEPGYRPQPKMLAYQPFHRDCLMNLVMCFQKALRVNPDVPLSLFIYDPEHDYSRKPGYAEMTSVNQMMPAYLPATFNVKDYTKIPADNLVKMADVIATASMQPDFGLDTFLYENNAGWFGKIYGFGTQPMGDPSLPLHSQMLFHMSAMYEDPRILSIAERLNENYPEYRAFLYLSLSRFAAETQHPYWSAVFLGWGLHYIQDLTQPYHTRLSYGLNPDRVLQAFAEMANHNQLPFLELQTIQENRHIILENLAEVIISSSDENDAYRKIILDAMANTENDNDILLCDLNSFYLREQISADPSDYQVILQSTIPSFYVNSASFHAGEASDFKTLFFNEMSKTQRRQFTHAVSSALGRYASFTRAVVRRCEERDWQ